MLFNFTGDCNGDDDYCRLIHKDMDIERGEIFIIMFLLHIFLYVLNSGYLNIILACCPYDFPPCVSICGNDKYCLLTEKFVLKVQAMLRPGRHNNLADTCMLYQYFAL